MNTSPSGLLIEAPRSELLAKFSVDPPKAAGEAANHPDDGHTKGDMPHPPENMGLSAPYYSTSPEVQFPPVM